MKSWFALFLLLCPHGLAAQSLASQPRLVTVGSRGAAVLSGIADESYVCDRLRAGAEVEVYDEPAPGVFAIRPPDNCCSWVRNSALEVHRDGTATVRDGGAACRIGREYGPGPNVQVRLEAGEEVTVLGPAEGLWRPIAPPNGEFRYVRETELLGATNGHKEERTFATGATLPQNKHPNTRLTAADGWNRRRGSFVLPLGGGVELAAHDGDRYGSSDDSFLAPPLATEPENVPAPLPMPPANGAAQAIKGAPMTGDPAPLTANDSSSPGGPLNATEPFQKSLDRLEANLARTVAERPNLWQFDELEREAARLFSFATTEEQKSAVRAVAARMDRFAVLAARYRELRVGDEIPSTVARTDDSTTGSASGYDAVGTLRPVVSKSGDAPQYALVDDQGKLLTLITPSPDVNLQSLLGRRVAVRGTKGYLPKFQQPHLTANRVSPVENLRR